MLCPNCGSDTKVSHTKKYDATITRRRICQGECKGTFTTHEERVSPVKIHTVSYVMDLTGPNGPSDDGIVAEVGNTFNTP